MVLEWIWTKLKTVCDGDTIVVFNGFQDIRVRLAWIDAPEDGQPFCGHSRDELMRILEGVDLCIRKICEDQYGRWICQVQTASGKDASSEMLKTGWAFYYAPKHPSRVHELIARAAIAEEIGLYAINGYIKPWDFRKKKGLPI
jgi:endonuclease YncB( thermonuclease family)